MVFGLCKILVMTVEQKILTPNKFSRPGVKLSHVRGVVIHWVGNANSSAIANRNYFENLKNQTTTKNARYASSHYIIGLNGEVLQCLPLDEWAYHVGAMTYKDEAIRKLSGYPNNCTIGIELCHPDWSGKFTEQTMKSAIELTAWLLRKYNLSCDCIFRHYDITGKDCPRFFVHNKNEWESFKLMVNC